MDGRDARAEVRHPPGVSISKVDISLAKKRDVVYRISINLAFPSLHDEEGPMTPSYPDTLALSRRVLRVLTTLNLLMGALILALLVASLLAESWVMTALGARSPPGKPMLFAGMRLIMVIGLGGVPIVHLVLARLLAIVETVSAGDPFVVANSAHLKAIAWAILALELMHLTVGAIAAAVSSPAVPLKIGWSISPTRWLAVLMLFVLARVFEQGARMREDLEGTV